MAKINTIIAKYQEEKSKPIKVKGEIINIFTALTTDDFAEIVSLIVDSCFNEKGEYESWRKPVITHYAMIAYFTDLDISDYSVNEIYELSQGQWFIEIERKVTNLEIWSDIETAVIDQINYRINTKKTSFDKLCEDISTIITTDNTESLIMAKEVLNGINKVDKKAFINAVINKKRRK